jgi:hypothetical protein
MKINHSAIRSSIKIIALIIFVSSIIWRLSNIMRFGGSVDNDTKITPVGSDDDVDDNSHSDLDVDG